MTPSAYGITGECMTSVGETDLINSIEDDKIDPQLLEQVGAIEDTADAAPVAESADDARRSGREAIHCFEFSADPLQGHRLDIGKKDRFEHPHTEERRVHDGVYFRLLCTE